jgi:enoyl-CoA hydratase/carnithine racemase
MGDGICPKTIRLYHAIKEVILKMSYRDKNYNTMLVTVEDNIAIVQFNRPEALNAVNAEMTAERFEILSEISKDSEVRAVILTGGEKVYCAGGDLVPFSKFGVEEVSRKKEAGI